MWKLLVNWRTVREALQLALTIIDAYSDKTITADEYRKMLLELLALLVVLGIVEEG